MPERYEGKNYSFLYPETWSLEEDESTDTVTLETPTGAFISITPTPDLEEAFQATARMMESEYEEVESEELAMQLADQSLEGMTQRFVYLDLIVTSHLLKLRAPGNPLLIQIQGEDRELDTLWQVFAAVLTSMCQSLK